MIYRKPSLDDPIRQGDIFRNIPRVDFSLSSLPVIDNGGAHQANWRDILSDIAHSEPITAVLSMQPVYGIVITQNCDTVRGEFICLCQVDDFLTAINQKQSPPKNVKAWQSLIVRLARTNLRWFYLPPDSEMGIVDRMAADFRVVLRIPRIDLENMQDLRIASLNDIAAEHFRETLGQFFRRYAYNEWYPLDREEFQSYGQGSPEQVEPYPWQK